MINWRRPYGSARRAGAPSADEEKASRAGPVVAWSHAGRPVWTPRDYASLAKEGFAKNPVAYRCVRLVAEAAKGVLVGLDPAAARETPLAEPRERLEFHARADGLVDLEAVMPKDQALRLSALVGPLAQSVCRADGRTMGQRQVAALVAWGNTDAPAL